MFTAVRRFIKTAILFLIAGLAMGGWLMVRRELFGRYADPHLTSAHVHAVLVGFVMFLILGVALWLFPRPPKEDTRYRPERIDTVYWVLTTSTAVRIVTEAARAYSASRTLAWVVVFAGFGQIAGFVYYFWVMWPRIRPVGSQLREQRGEKF